MKRILFVATIVLSLPGAAVAQDLKIGYINVQQVLEEAPGAREARDELEAEVATYQTELEQLSTELDDLVTKYEQQQALFSPAARQTREADIRAKQQAMQERAAVIEQRHGLRQQELLQPIMDRINTAIEEIRVEGSYSLIIDASTGVVVAADPLFDLTQEVSARLQADAAVAPTTGGL